jgi:hypothetical protein
MFHAVYFYVSLSGLLCFFRVSASGFVVCQLKLLIGDCCYIVMQEFIQNGIPYLGTTVSLYCRNSSIKINDYESCIETEKAVTMYKLTQQAALLEENHVRLCDG